MNSPASICSRCVMDSSAAEFQLTQSGCNFCDAMLDSIKKKPTPSERDIIRSRLIDQIKEDGRGRPYDCVMGVSGGTDSTYVAYLAKHFGLRPLAVHLDNGWNSELAVANIESVLKGLKIPLHTFVLDWDAFRRLQLAFLRASVPDAEIPTDHAIHGALFRIASKYRIRWLLSGANFSTEAILPRSWTYGVLDWTYIHGIFKQFGEGTLGNYPKISFSRYQWYTRLKRLSYVYLLDLINYNKIEAVRTLSTELRWRDYGGKHYESIYTRFFQGYILPVKFNIDKRKAHLSTLIISGQSTREEAMEKLKQEIYPMGLLCEDRAFVIKKLGIQDADFEEIMHSRPRRYSEFPNSERFLKRFAALRLARKWRLQPFKQ